MTIGIRWKSCLAVLLAALIVTAPGCGQRDLADPVGRAAGGVADAVAAKGNDARPGDDASIEDAELTARVRAAIFVEPGLQAQPIDVDSRDAVVTLAGSVDSPSLHDRAIRIAGSVDGVLQVQDRLEVKS
jgi:hyperosmotically inducible protein